MGDDLDIYNETDDTQCGDDEDEDDNDDRVPNGTDDDNDEYGQMLVYFMFFSGI